jgi:hypothetical protein
MANPESVKIPYQTFKQMLVICEEMKYVIDIHQLKFGYYSDLEDVLSVLEDKRDSLELRRAYSKLAAANKNGSEDEQFNARIEYLKKRGPSKPRLP